MSFLMRAAETLSSFILTSRFDKFNRKSKDSSYNDATCQRELRALPQWVQTGSTRRRPINNPETDGGTCFIWLMETFQTEMFLKKHLNVQQLVKLLTHTKLYTVSDATVHNTAAFQSTDFLYHRLPWKPPEKWIYVFSSSSRRTWSLHQSHNWKLNWH